MNVKELLMDKIRHPAISNRIYYEITSVCNLRCLHCSDLLRGSSTRYLPSEKILKFHSGMAKLGVDSSVVTGGEPLLHKEFYEIVTGLAATGQVLITSNGTVAELKRITHLLESNPNVVLQISMDGISKKVFEEIRGENTFDKVIGLIEHLLSKGLNKQIGLSMTIMRQNVNQVSEIIGFARKRKIGFVHFPVLLPVGIARETWGHMSPSVQQQIWIEEQILKEMADDTRDTGISSNRIEQVLTRVTHGATGDCIGNATLKVTPEGFILPCPATSNADMRLGSIDEEGIAGLLTERLSARIDDYTSLVGPELSKCKDCSAYNYCLSRFCANCGLLSAPSSYHAEYSCTILQHHITNAMKEINNEMQH